MPIKVTAETHRVFKSCKKRYEFDYLVSKDNTCPGIFSVFYRCRNNAFIKTFRDISSRCLTVDGLLEHNTARVYPVFRENLESEIVLLKASFNGENRDQADDFFEESWKFLLEKIKVLGKYKITPRPENPIPINYGKGYELEMDSDLILEKDDVSIVVYIPTKKSERKSETLTKLDFMMYTYGLSRKDFSNIRGVFINVSSQESKVLDVQRCNSESIKKFKPIIIDMIKSIDSGRLDPKPKSSVCGACNSSEICPAYRTKFPDRRSIAEMEKSIISSGITEMEWQ